MYRNNVMSNCITNNNDCSDFTTLRLFFFYFKINLFKKRKETPLDIRLQNVHKCCANEQQTEF